jgi:hypothetical protein
MTGSPFEDAEALRLFPTLVSKVRLVEERRDTIEAIVVPHLSARVGGSRREPGGAGSERSEPEPGSAGLRGHVCPISRNHDTMLRLGHPRLEECYVVPPGPGLSDHLGSGA